MCSCNKYIELEFDKKVFHRFFARIFDRFPGMTKDGLAHNLGRTALVKALLGCWCLRCVATMVTPSAARAKMAADKMAEPSAPVLDRLRALVPLPVCSPSCVLLSVPDCLVPFWLPALVPALTLPPWQLPALSLSAGLAWS